MHSRYKNRLDCMCWQCSAKCSFHITNLCDTVTYTCSARQQPLSKQLNDQPLLGNNSVNNGSFCAIAATVERSVVKTAFLSGIRGCIRKFPDYCLTASVTEDGRGGQDHTSTSLLDQSVTWQLHSEHVCFYTSAFSTSCFILSAMDGKIEQHGCIKFRVTR
jgi:hypothetical protein